MSSSLLESQIAAFQEGFFYQPARKYYVNLLEDRFVSIFFTLRLIRALMLIYIYIFISISVLRNFYHRKYTNRESKYLSSVIRSSFL